MILFTADWHIKLGQKNVPREWAINRYHMFFKQIHELEMQCNMHIIGGDLFDRLPNMEELELYFDFISYAQYATINREISLDPPYLFEEQQPIDQGEDKPQKFVPVVIKRDPSLTNDRLGPEHSRMVGESILEKLEEVFGKTDSKLPTIENNSRPDSATLLVALKQLVNLFLVNGYAFNGSVSILSDSRDSTSAAGAKFLLSLNSPATIWSSKILQVEGAKVSNSFLTKAATEFVRHTGYKVSSTIKYDGTTENITIMVL